MTHPEIFNKSYETPEDKLAKKEFDSEKLKKEGLYSKEIDLLRVTQKNRSPENAKREVAKSFEEKLDSTLLDKIKGSRMERELEGEV